MATKKKTAVRPDVPEDGADDGEADAGPYPLFPGMPDGSVAYCKAFRVTPGPGGARGEKYACWPERFEAPELLDEIELAQHVGGGTYDVKAYDARNRIVTGARVELPGPPREPSYAPSPAAATTPGAGVVQAVQTGAGAALAIEGLPPAAQREWLWMQKQADEARERSEREATRVREDANRQVELITRMFESVNGGGGARGASEESAAIIRELKHQLSEERRINAQLRLENEALLKARFAATAKGGEGESIGTVLLTALERAPELLEALRIVKGGEATKALPEGAAATNGAGAVNGVAQH